MLPPSNGSTPADQSPHPSAPTSPPAPAKDPKGPAGSVNALIKWLVQFLGQQKPRPVTAEPKVPQTAVDGTGRTIRAIAFAGGGFDTANQLGLIHALVVGRCQPPDLVAGISAGAVNAVTLAEVMHAGNPAVHEPDRAAQVARFREIFEAVRDYPDEFFRHSFPDPFEVDARAPLKPAPLPLHFQEERDERLKALNARFGLIRLFNGILGVTLPLSVITRIIRCVLEFRQLDEAPWYRRWAGKLQAIVALWVTCGVNLHHITPTATRLVLGSLFANRYKRLLERLAKQQLYRREPLQRLITDVWRAILAFCDFPAPATAGEIIRRRTLGRGMDALRNSSGFTFLLSAWIFTGYPITLGLVLAADSVTWRDVLPLGLPPQIRLPILIVGVLWGIGVLAIVAVILSRKLKNILKSVALERLFFSYDLAQDLATPFAIKPFLVRHFDPEYYGRNNINRVVDRALAGDAAPAEGSSTARPKQLGDYASPHLPPGKPRIHVRPLVADLKTGRLLPVAPEASVVKAILAAGAVVPFFRPQKITAVLEDGRKGEITAIDGLNISNDPLLAMFSLLAYLYKEGDEIIFGKTNQAGVSAHHPMKHRIECYPVTSLPAKATALEGSGGNGGNRVRLCDVVTRALELQRFRDAELAEQLVSLFHRVLPTQPFYSVDRYDGRGSFVYVRADVRPIRPDFAPALNERVLVAEDGNERRNIMAEGVADGCRAALETFLAETIWEIARENPGDSVDCQDAVARHVRNGGALPGSASGCGPGIPEVCRHCVRGRGTPHAKARQLGVPGLAGTNGGKVPSNWPLWGEAAAAPSPTVIQTNGADRTEPETAPAISMLFSGGVFRGVFQVGVVTALEQVGARPQVIAGASVGSITAAVACEVFRTKDPARRSRLVTDMAATFLCIDKLVMTDRFADFVRRVTLRAAETRFSFHDADRFFRRFDEPGGTEFSEVSRRVLAGIERLFYVSPFAVHELVSAFRGERHREVDQRLRDALEEFLEHAGVAQEILGSEPLDILLKHLIADRHRDPESLTFESFIDPAERHPLGGIHLLATTTNLTNGELLVLGEDPDKRAATSLREGLLASSAFPAVFRPRWHWEVVRGSSSADQLIDGGVMDNLPIAAVTGFLNRARQAGKIGRAGTRGAPHLLFTASLEPDTPELDDKEVAHAEAFWVRSWTRAGQLRYNKKITDYARAQTHFREIVRLRAKTGHLPPPSELPLDMEVVCVMPKWLCGTFSFHPMLGFRRVKQARSIAHGCASTLAKLHLVARHRKDWLDAWQIEDRVNSACVTADRRPGRYMEVARILPMSAGEAGDAGSCWLRRGVPCPFSRQALLRARERELGDPATVPNAMSLNQITELSVIYSECGCKSTHTEQ